MRIHPRRPLPLTLYPLLVDLDNGRGPLAGGTVVERILVPLGRKAPLVLRMNALYCTNPLLFVRYHLTSRRGQGVALQVPSGVAPRCPYFRLVSFKRCNPVRLEPDRIQCRAGP